ncbi:hypothetical protein BH23CHL4_BH23CHL4_24860 [soil metagenome]
MDLGIDPPTGKCKQKRITGKTRKETERKAAEAIQRAESGYFDSKTLTVEAFLMQWLDATSPTLRPASMRRYRDAVRLHIVANVGGLKLGRLTPGDVQRMFARLLERLSGTTVIEGDDDRMVTPASSTRFCRPLVVRNMHRTTKAPC